MNCRFLATLGMTLVSSAHAQTIVRDSIPGTLVAFEMVRVPSRNIMIGRTELLWDAYDQFMMSGPPPAQRGDASLRPSRPYGAPDYGWGHRGFATISIAREAAIAFCEWLSAETGRKYRLPTEAEWEYVASIARGTMPIDSLAWHAGNSSSRAHRAASKQPDALGLYDLFGNAAEWVTADDGQRVTRGGSFRDAASIVGPGARAVQHDDWNERDPQIPKSRWWLSDGPFVGFRIIRELP